MFRGGKNIILWSRWLREASHSQISGGKEEQMWKEWTEISRFLKDDLVSQLFFPPRFIYLFVAASSRAPVAARRLSPVAVTGVTLHCGAGPSSPWLLSLRGTGSRLLAWLLQAGSVSRLSFRMCVLASLSLTLLLSPTFSPWRRCVLAQSRSVSLHSPVWKPSRGLPEGRPLGRNSVRATWGRCWEVSPGARRETAPDRKSRCKVQSSGSTWWPQRAK